ncbi:hypothetical protein [Ferrimonas aestuarii]|uniref:Uncharacterized protein n=1 Tax=Ferrimonas aestuarii TaxID=2569539 RepID=A0A4V5NZT0_9GAMM|nr:hypothetical protein [Ferrimonas aestuarii]TKB58258.1 hypothetical protein FCL42_00395 [Ferrimonas aestuarii]
MESIMQGNGKGRLLTTLSLMVMAVMLLQKHYDSSQLQQQLYQLELELETTQRQLQRLQTLNNVAGKVR